MRGIRSIDDVDNVRNNTLRPQFNSKYEMDAEFPGTTKLRIEVWDKNTIMFDKMIGYTEIDLEDRWYERWTQSGCFRSKPDDRDAYTVVIPPPNVTGVLHLGHMLNNTIQDILIRRARLEGRSALWIPGTDHAGIATQTVVETLTPAGRMVQAKVRTACEKGSLGAWMDRLLAEPYDALVVFSDFQDGVRLYETKKGEPKMVWSDSSYHKFGGAQKGQTRWQREWLEAFAKGAQGRGPRLYLFSVQQEPQAFLRACVTASGGAWTSVSWLRKGGRKAP